MNSTSDRLGAYTASQVTDARSRDFVRNVVALFNNDNRPEHAAKYFELRWPRSMSLDLVTKAAIQAGSTTDSTWAGPLAIAKPLVDAFLSYVRPRTLLDRIPGLRQVPFNISVSNQTGSGTYGWVGQGVPKIVTKAGYATVTLGIAKAAGIIVVSDELMRLSKPSAEVALRDELAGGIADFLNAQFVDPAVAAVANVSPASITNAATPTVSSGTLAANALTDIKALVASFAAAHPDVETAVILMSPRNAFALSASGNFPDLRLNGGTIFGIPVLTSSALGTNVVMVDPAYVLIADDGDVQVTASVAATIIMNDAPTGVVQTAGAAPTHVSLFQSNLVGLKADRFINWKVGKASAVQYISGAAYV